MKYVVILGDGMADYPVSALGGKTPLAVAKKPYIDKLYLYDYQLPDFHCYLMILILLI